MYWFSSYCCSPYKSHSIERKLPDIPNLDAKTAPNTKATEGQIKIPNITNLATKAFLEIKATEIENEIPDTAAFITTAELNR